jgi:hypothetical protein
MVEQSGQDCLPLTRTNYRPILKLIILTDNGIKEVSTGNTPRKRKWQYNGEWALTKTSKSHDESLQAQTSTSTTKIVELKNEDDKLPTPTTTFGYVVHLVFFNYSYY